MNRYRGPGGSGPSKATSSTLCQKCLNRDKCGHDRRKGIADEVLANKEQERGRRPGGVEDERINNGRSSRSPSSSSVSTISTGRSRSASPRPTRSYQDANRHSLSPHSWTENPKKRRRLRASSSDSYHSHSPSAAGRSTTSSEGRNMRRRHGARSPDERGRHRSRSGSRRLESYSRSSSRGDMPRRRRSSPPSRRGTDERPARYASRDRGPDRRLEEHRPREVYRSRDRSVSRSRPQMSQPEPVSVRTAPPRRKERSLSPYSKRLALTQAMNTRA
ncbi:MAG: hypothetical protein M1823_001425 [Watsoniomyces obsoletus]|nr:MAG: hypothetical protein M1823_001425 [Watsoniomyces obsoletus]